MPQGRGDSLRYLERGWNRKEGRGAKILKRGGQAGPRKGCVKKVDAWHLLTNFGTMNPKPCFSRWNFPVMILCGIPTIEVDWFDPKLLFDLPRKLFTILELSRNCVLFPIFSCAAFNHFKNSFWHPTLNIVYFNL